MTEIDNFFKKMTAYQDDDFNFESIPLTVSDIKIDTIHGELAPVIQYDAKFWEDINNKGFLIYNYDNEFTLLKISTPNDIRTLAEATYPSMHDAVEAMHVFLNKKELFKYSVTAMYNKGFGPEYTTVDLDAINDEDAMVSAREIFAKEGLSQQDLDVMVTKI